MAGGIGIREPLTPLDPFRDKPPVTSSATWMDYGRALVSGGYGTVGSIAGGLEYLTGGRQGGTLAGIREWGAQGAEEQVKAMSPYARERISAPVLSTDEKSMWGQGVGGAVSSLALKTTQAVPSLATTVVPGGAVAKGVGLLGAGTKAAGIAGTIAGGAVGSVTSGGDVYSRITDSVMKVNDKKLREQSPFYNGMREMGLSEEDAKEQLRSEAAGYMPIYVGLVTALTTKFGVESLVAQKAAGEAVKRGLIRGTLVGVAGESTQEGAEGIAQGIASQLGEQRAGARDSFDWANIADEALQGALAGGVLGGAVGAAARGRPEPAKPGTGDKDVDTTLTPPSTTEEGTQGPMTLTVGPSAVEGEPTQQDEVNAAEEEAKRAGEALGQQIEDVRGPDEKPDVPQAQAQPAVPGATAPVEGAQAEVAAEKAAPQAPGEAPAVDPSVQVALAPEAPQAAPEAPEADVEGTYDADAFISEDEDIDALAGPPEPPRENFIPEVEQRLAGGLPAPAEVPAVPAPAEAEVAPPVAEPAGALAPAAEPPLSAGAAEAEVAATEVAPTVEGTAAAPPTEAPLSAGGAEAQAQLGATTEEVPLPGEEAPLSAGSREAVVTPESVGPEVPAVEPPPPQGPRRVLADLTPAKPAEKPAQPKGVQEVKQRVSKKEAERAAEGEGVVAHPEIKEDVNADRRAFYPMAEKLQKAGAELSLDMQEILALKGKFQGKSGKLNTERYKQLRQILLTQNKAEIAGRAEAGKVVRQTQEDIEAKKAAEKLVKDEEEAGKLIKGQVYSEEVKKGDVTAMRKHAQQLIASANREGIEIPGKVMEDTTPALAHLVQARSVATSGGRRALMDFMGNDLDLRQGSGELAKTYRAAEALKKGAGGEVAVAAEDVSAQAEFRAQQASEAEPEAEVRSEEEPTPEAKERPQPKVDVSKAVTQGVSKAGTFVFETKPARKLPPKPPPRKNVTEPHPTPAQREAGNYPKRHDIVMGLPVSVETEAGQVREAPDGSFKAKLKHAYGYIRGTIGADGDQMDILIGPYHRRNIAYVIEQVNPQTGKFDEHKVVVGAENQEEAAEIYDSMFSDGSGPDRRGTMHLMSASLFREWVKKPRTERAPKITEKEVQAARRAESKAVHKDEAAAAEVVAEDLKPEPDVAPMELEEFFGVEPKQQTGTVRLADALSHHIETLREAIAGRYFSPGQATIMTQALNRIRALAHDVDVEIITDAQMDKLQEEVRPGSLAKSRWGGFYRGSDDKIYIRSSYMASAKGGLAENVLEARILIHEGIHAAYLRATRNHPEVAKQLEGLLAAAQAKFAEEGESNLMVRYGLTNVDEFLAEAFSNQEFQDFLMRVPVSPEMAKAAGLRSLGPTKLKLVSAWTSFVMGVKKLMFGNNPAITYNALESVLRLTEHLDQRTQDIGRTRWGRTGKPVPEASPIYVNRQLVKDEASLRSKAGRFRLRAFTIKARTFDQLRQHGRGLFWSPSGDALENLVAGLQRIAPWRQKKRLEGEKIAADWATMKRKNPNVMHAAEELAIDFTTHEYEPGMFPPPAKGKKAGDATSSWQARGQAADMDARWAKLPPDVQAIMKRMSAYYRDLANANSKKAIENNLNELTTLSPKDKADIQAKLMAGTITDADRTLVKAHVVQGMDGDKLLDGLRPMKMLKGMYFPLMRHGDFVVQTQDDMPANLMGGKLYNDNTVEFRAQTDKAARDQARAFSKAQKNLKAGAARKVFYDRTTGKQVTNITAKTNLAAYDVAYRIPLQTKGVYMFETATEAERFRRDYQGGKASEVQNKRDFQGGDDISTAQMRALKQAIEGNDKLKEGTKKLLGAAMEQAAIRMMSGNRIQHRTLTRKNWKGASTDLARATAVYADSASGLLAKATFMPEARKHLEEMRKVLNDNTFDKNQPVRRDIFNEVERRLKRDAADYNQLPEPMQNMMSLTFLARLGSLMYSVINATQPQMTTWPMLMGRHGGFRAEGALLKAFWDIGGLKAWGAGFANVGRATWNIREIAINTDDILGSIRKNVKDPAELQMLDAIIERGGIDPQSGMELASPVLTAKGPTAKAISKVDRIARQLPVAVEAVNRAISALAAYRLGRADGMSHDQATAYAFDTVQNTQGDYSAMNEWGILREYKWAKPALQFKKYAQMMTALTADMVKRSFGSAGPAEKAVARKQLMALMAVQIAAAGTMGLPGLEIAKLTFMMLAALGLTDGWEEQERKLRDFADEVIGKTASELVTKGVITRMIGIDMSKRMSLADMWTFGEPEDYDKESLKAYAWSMITGAPGGLASDMLEAANHAREGDFGKAFSKGFPVKAVTDLVKAGRGLSEGELNFPEALLKAAGGRSAREAEHGETVGRAIKANKDRQKERQGLVKRYIGAKGTELPGLLKEIKQFNERETAAGVRTPVRLKIFPKALDHIRKREADRRFRITGER